MAAGGNDCDADGKIIFQHVYLFCKAGKNAWQPGSQHSFYSRTQQTRSEICLNNPGVTLPVQLFMFYVSTINICHCWVTAESVHAFTPSQPLTL